MRLALSSPFIFSLLTMIQSKRYGMENCQDKKDSNNDEKLHCGQVDQNNSGCGDTKMKVLVPSTSSGFFNKDKMRNTIEMVTALTISAGRCRSSCLVEVVRICRLVTKVQHNNLPEEEVLEKIEKWKSKSEMMWFYSKILPTSINSWLYHQQPSPQLSST